MRLSYAELDPADLIRLAATRDQSAWDELVRRYAPLVWRVAQSHRLDPADAGDVSQHTWITLADRLDRIRDPDRLPGWLATTAHREAVRIAKARSREVHGSLESLPETAIERCPEQYALRAARDRQLWRAFAALPERCQRLLAILANAPSLSYDQLSQVLGIRRGSIGPSRGRCLHELRRKLAILGLTEGAAG